MYFYHKVISDALSVNEKWGNLRRGSGGKHTSIRSEPETGRGRGRKSFHLSGGFIYLFDFGLSCRDKNNGFLVPRPWGRRTSNPPGTWNTGELEG